MDPYTQTIIAFCAMVEAIAKAREAELRLMTPEQYAQDRNKADKVLEILGLDHLFQALVQVSALHAPKQG